MTYSNHYCRTCRRTYNDSEARFCTYCGLPLQPLWQGPYLEFDHKVDPKKFLKTLSKFVSPEKGYGGLEEGVTLEELDSAIDSIKITEKQIVIRRLNLDMGGVRSEAQVAREMGLKKEEYMRQEREAIHGLYWALIVLKNEESDRKATSEGIRKANAGKYVDLTLQEKRLIGQLGYRTKPKS